MHGDGTEQDGDDVDNERGTRIHKDPNKQGYHGIRHEIGTLCRGVFHPRGDAREEGQHEVEQQEATHGVEIFLTEEVKVEQEHQQEQSHNDELADGLQAKLAVVVVTFDGLLLHRLKNAYSLLGNDFAPIDNLLSALHHAAGKGDGREEVLVSRSGLAIVGLYIHREIVVDVT